MNLSFFLIYSTYDYISSIWRIRIHYYYGNIHGENSRELQGELEYEKTHWQFRLGFKLLAQRVD